MIFPNFVNKVQKIIQLNQQQYLSQANIDQMFPFQKIFTVLIRTFSRPMLGYIKRKQQQKLGSKFGILFIGLGRKSYAFQHWVNVRILKTNRKQTNELKDEILLQKGVQSFYQIMFYLIVLGLPFWQLYKSSIAAQKKQENLQNRFTNLQKKMIHINQKINKIVEYSKEKSKQEKERALRKAQRLNKNNNKVKDKNKQNVELNIIGEVSPQGQSISQKLQQIFENAIEVVADQFEESLDQLQFLNSNEQIDLSDSDVAQSQQIQLDTQSLQVDVDTSNEINVESEVSIEVQQSLDVGQ